MVKAKKGNLLEAKEDIIVHQVNVDGIMGGGVARQLADRFPGLEEFYAKHCEELENSYEFLNGNILFYGSGDKIIANMFSQFPNFETDYESMKIALKYLKKWANKNNRTIAMPYGIGCGIAKGDWNKVFKLIEEVFSDYEITLYRLED